MMTPLEGAMLDRVDAELPDDHQERLSALTLRLVVGICAKVATEVQDALNG